jgi:hypothetical protein
MYHMPVYNGVGVAALDDGAAAVGGSALFAGPAGRGCLLLSAIWTEKGIIRDLTATGCAHTQHKKSPPGHTCQSLPGGGIIRIAVGRIIAFRQADLSTPRRLPPAGRFFVFRKPLARRVVRKKTNVDHDGIKTPFAIIGVRSANCTNKQREVIQK